MKNCKLLIAIATLIFSGLATADNHSATKFTATKINDNLVLLQAKGGNIAVSSGSDGVLIIDDEYPDMSAALKAEIDKLGGSGNLKYILTHEGFAPGENDNGLSHLCDFVHELESGFCIQLTRVGAVFGCRPAVDTAEVAASSGLPRHKPQFRLFFGMTGSMPICWR